MDTTLHKLQEHLKEVAIRMMLGETIVYSTTKMEDTQAGRKWRYSNKKIGKWICDSVIESCGICPVKNVIKNGCPIGEHYSEVIKIEDIREVIDIIEREIKHDQISTRK